MPGANLTSFGAVRDIEKWPARDRRTVCRDIINFEEYNPLRRGRHARGREHPPRARRARPPTPRSTPTTRPSSAPRHCAAD